MLKPKRFGKFARAFVMPPRKTAAKPRVTKADGRLRFQRKRSPPDTVRMSGGPMSQIKNAALDTCVVISRVA